MHPLLNIAVNAARSAGNIIIRAIDKLDSIKVQNKARHDYVTEIDQIAEQEIISIIHKAYPEHAICGEESGSIGQSEFVWIIDPLDGTTNFIHGFPHFAVSIAVEHKGAIEHGVIYDPLKQDLFTATKGCGARRNEHRMRVSQHSKLEEALLGTGFPYTNPAQLTDYLKTFSSIFPLTAGIRRSGSAALDLAYTAAGILDGFWEANLAKWDIAAGSLMIQETGGLISDFYGEDNYLTSGNVIAGTPKVFKALLKTIHNSLR